MKKFCFGRFVVIVCGSLVSPVSGYVFFESLMNTIPWQYTLSFISSQEVTTDTLYKPGTIVAKYTHPRMNGFASFLEGSCTDYAAKQRPDLFLNTDGSRRITGNAEDWLNNAQKLGITTGSTPKKGAIAVYYTGKGAREYGHAAYIEDIQPNGVIVVSEMNYEEEYVVTIRAIDADLAAGYIY